MVGFSLLTMLVCLVHGPQFLREQGVSAPARHLAIGAGFVVVFAGLFAGLPADADPGEFPAGLLWSFRLSSMGTQLVFWTGLGVAIFGLLCERANRRTSNGSTA